MKNTRHLKAKAKIRVRKIQHRNGYFAAVTFSSLLILLPLFILFLLSSCANNTTENVKDELDTLSEKVETAVDNMKEEIIEYNDEDFIRNSIEKNEQELQLLTLATTKGTNANIKKLAKKMLTDHKHLGDALRQYASEKNIEVKTEYDEDNMLRDKNAGDEWDSHWANIMVDEHEEMVNKFDNAASKTTDNNLKQMVSKYLPVLKDHLNELKQLEDHINNNM